MALGLATAQTAHAALHLLLNATLAGAGLAAWIAPLIGLETLAYLWTTSWGTPRPWHAWLQRQSARYLPGTAQWTAGRWTIAWTAPRALLPALTATHPLLAVMATAMNGITRPPLVAMGLATQTRYQELQGRQLAEHMATQYGMTALLASAGGWAVTQGTAGLWAIATAAGAITAGGTWLLHRHPWVTKLDDVRERWASTVEPARWGDWRHHALAAACSEHGTGVTILAFVGAASATVAMTTTTATETAGLATAMAWIGAAIGSMLCQWGPQRTRQAMQTHGGWLTAAGVTIGGALGMALPETEVWLATTLIGAIGGARVTTAFGRQLGTAPTATEGETHMQRGLRSLQGQAMALLAWTPLYTVAIAYGGWLGFTGTAVVATLSSGAAGRKRAPNKTTA